MKRKHLNRKTGYLFSVLLSFFLTLNAGTNIIAQGNTGKIKITGTVYDETKQPLAGASVREERSTNGTITDQNGRFSIFVQKGYFAYFFSGT